MFITVPQAARTVRVRVADFGALDEPIDPPPLITDETMTADYAKGRAPWGHDLRGDAAALSLYQRHLLITGLPNRGQDRRPASPGVAAHAGQGVGGARAVRSNTSP